MKKAALFLMMSSTAFAAPQQVAKTVAQRPPQLARKIVHTKRAPQIPLEIAPQAAKTAPQAAKAAPQTAKTAPQQAPLTPRQRVTKNSAAKQALVTDQPGIKAPKFGDFELKAQLRNTMTAARAEELQNIGGQNYGLGTEVRVGLKHESGWGFNFTASHQTNNFADSARNTGTNGDASLMVYAPAFFKNDFVNWAALGRAYLPTSDKSRNNHVQSYEGRNMLDFNFGHKMTLSNLTILRMWERDVKAASDGTTMVYNALEFYHQTTQSMALAFGTQYENDGSVASGTGTQIDIYPFIDFTIIPNVLIETKYYFPVFVGGNGSVGASGPALNQSQAELFVKIAI